MPIHKEDRIQRNYEITSLYSLYLEGRLDEKGQMEVEKMIENCEECQLIFDSFKDFLDEDNATTFKILNEPSLEISKKRFAQLANDIPENSQVVSKQFLLNIEFENIICPHNS